MKTPLNLEQQLATKEGRNAVREAFINHFHGSHFVIPPKLYEMFKTSGLVVKGELTDKED